MKETSHRGVALVLSLALFLPAPRVFAEGSLSSRESEDRHGTVHQLAVGGSPIWTDGELVGDVIYLSVVFAEGDRETVRYRLPDETAEFAFSDVKSIAPAVYPGLPEFWYAGNPSTAPLSTHDGALGIDQEGHRLLIRPGGKHRLVADNLLPDSRLVTLDKSENAHRVAALGKPTESYPYAVLVGDVLAPEERRK